MSNKNFAELVRTSWTENEGAEAKSDQPYMSNKNVAELVRRRNKKKQKKTSSVSNKKAFERNSGVSDRKKSKMNRKITAGHRPESGR